jgi:hypothetical protein
LSMRLLFVSQWGGGCLIYEAGGKH